MARKKQIKRMKEALPECVLNTIPKEKQNDREFLFDVLMYRRENMKSGRAERKRLTTKFNKEHKTYNVKVLLRWNKINGKTQLTDKDKRNLRKDKNLIIELMKVIHSKFPKLITLFTEIADKRNPNKVKYSMKTIVLVRLLALVCGIVSMNEINEKFNKEEIIENIRTITGEDVNSIPNWQTIQDVLEDMNIEDLLDIKNYMVDRILESKMFNKFRYNGLVQVLVDATGISCSKYNLNGNCISKKHKKSDTTYHKYVLEAKIVFGNIVISIDSEWIENGNLNNETGKQDCEIKAFKRMADRIKKNYPRLPILITGDALYANKTVIQICEGKNWKYICNLKTTRLKRISNSFKKGNNETDIPDYKIVSNIEYEGHTLTALSYTEKNKKDTRTFRYITNLDVNSSNVSKVVELGRSRWKIENEGFNMQKNGQYKISHLCSRNDNAMKIHYQFIQIAHILRQLLELGSIEVKKMCLQTKREITSLLLDSLKQIISNLQLSIQKIQLRFDM